MIALEKWKFQNWKFRRLRFKTAVKIWLSILVLVMLTDEEFLRNDPYHFFAFLMEIGAYAGFTLAFSQITLTVGQNIFPKNG